MDIVGSMFMFEMCFVGNFWGYDGILFFGMLLCFFN